MLLGKIIHQIMVFPLLFSAILPIFAPEINKCSNNPLKEKIVMKRMIMTLVAVWMIITSMNAQRLTNIQAEARFITDKMVVELGLSSVQRNSILNINLNYLNGIRSYRDIDAYGWHYRNKQLKRMMTARQWKRFKDSYYFYRPIGWNNHVYEIEIERVLESLP